MKQTRHLDEYRYSFRYHYRNLLVSVSINSFALKCVVCLVTKGLDMREVWFHETYVGVPFTSMSNMFQLERHYTIALPFSKNGPFTRIHVHVHLTRVDATY